MKIRRVLCFSQKIKKNIIFKDGYYSVVVMFYQKYFDAICKTVRLNVDEVR